MLLAATRPQAVQPAGRERLARLLLAFTGLTLALGPPVAMLAGTPGWSSVALMTVMPLGVLLVVLAAFYPRITGTVRFGLFSVTIGPSVTHTVEARPLDRQASSARDTQTETGTRDMSEDGLAAVEGGRSAVM